MAGHASTCTQVCVCVLVRFQLCVPGGYLKRAVRLSLAPLQGAAFACLSWDHGPCQYMPARRPLSLPLRRRSLGTQVLELTPHPWLSLLRMETCFLGNLLDSGPWVNFRMRCVLKAAAAVLMRGDRLSVRWGDRLGWESQRRKLCCRLITGGSEGLSFQGLIRWHAKCIKFCRHFNSNMLDSWVSPEAAGFFISFTEGRNPLLPAPPPTRPTRLHDSLSLSPSLSSTIFLASCSLLIEKLNDTSGPCPKEGILSLLPSCPEIKDLQGRGGGGGV